MRRVLVIDDHEPSRKYLVELLIQRGYEIAGEGVSGELALTMAETLAPDVILMAVGLSDLDGIDAARAILRSNPLPIILLTSHFDAATIDRAKQAGVMAYLVKPLRAEELSPTIELAISRFREFSSLQEENSTLKENLAGRKLIERAKGLLMAQRNISEAEAYSLIKKASMNMRKPMADVAQAILVSAEITEGKK